MYNKAAEFKGKVLQALQKNGSPSRLRRALEKGGKLQREGKSASADRFAAILKEEEYERAQYKIENGLPPSPQKIDLSKKENVSEFVLGQSVEAKARGEDSPMR